MKARTSPRGPSAARRKPRSGGAGGIPVASVPARAARDERLIAALTAWFDAAAREMPWRRTRDPYAIWLSEIMLQQTRVDTVIPYYERFLERFPTASVLAAAELDDVLAMWSGLGYYRRARELHRAAREVTERFGGSLPGTAAELRSLPGIGRYTAGAIASIAFGRREPLVDGNVARVLARVFGLEDDVGGTIGARSLWALADRLVPESRPGRFNEALMELGATVCTPREPRCAACPLRDECVASRDGRQAELPRLAARSAPRRVAMVAAVVRCGERVVLAQRAPGGLFGGMWEPPMTEAGTLIDARARLLTAGLPRRLVLRDAGRVAHTLSHRELDVLVVRADARTERALSAPSTPYERAAWSSPEDGRMGISALARKILAAAG